MLTGALSLLVLPAFAADDAIATRQALMDNNGSAAALSGAIMKGELAYSPAIGKAVVNAFDATALAYGSFFPEESADDPRTAASPKIWEDRAGFEAALGKFQAAAASAKQAAGEHGFPDDAAFVAAVKPVLGTCNGCHETYRIKK
jgi:cytochrome c556